MFYKRKNAHADPLASSAGALNPKSLVVVLNGVSVVSGVIYLISFNSSARFFCILSAIAASVLVIYVNYGLPRVSRAAIRGPLQDYFGKCMSGAEFAFLFFCLMFTNDATSKQVGLIPFGLGDYVSAALIIRRCVWFLGSHGVVAWKGVSVWERFFLPTWTRLNARSNSIVEFSSLIEIGLGFWLILLVVTPARQIMICFVYWNFLRIRFLAPRSRASHQAAWSRVDTKTHSLRRSIPIIETPVSFMKHWFNPTPQ